MILKAVTSVLAEFGLKLWFETYLVNVGGTNFLHMIVSDTFLSPWSF